MVAANISRDPEADPRARRAFDQLNGLLPRFTQTLASSVTSTGNTAAVETTLFSYSLPVNELSTKDSLTFEASGTFAATASTNKVIAVKFGATTIYSSGNLAITTANSWVIRGSISKIDNATQICDLTIVTSSSVLVAKSVSISAAEALTATVSLVVTGNGTNANDILGKRFHVLKTPGI